MPESVVSDTRCGGVELGRDNRPEPPIRFPKDFPSPELDCLWFNDLRGTK